MKYKNSKELLKKIINIPSVSGNEKKMGDFLIDLLEKEGFKIKKISLDSTRFNVFAYIGKPKIILQAHMDTVGPYIPFCEDEKYIYGRGSCDTKASVACMIMAGKLAKDDGLLNFGLLFTVGEEVDFAGAKQAEEFIQKLGSFLIVGEPTNLKPIKAHYGMSVFSIECSGKAVHSSKPELGVNAIDKLVSLLNKQVKKLKVNKGTLMSLVKIEGGIADNIIPDKANALFSLRIAPTDNKNYPVEMQKIIGDIGKIGMIQSAPPVNCEIPKSLAFLGKGEEVKYATELSFFKNGLILGPGDISVAHGPDEKILKSQLEEAVLIYKKILNSLVKTIL